jgi:hypothetical protein
MLWTERFVQQIKSEHNVDFPWQQCLREEDKIFLYIKCLYFIPLSKNNAKLVGMLVVNLHIKFPCLAPVLH